MNARSFTDRDIHLALDGELPEDERAAYQAWLEANPDMKARSLRFAADNAALRGLFTGVLDEPVPARLTAVVKGDAPKRKGTPPWWRMAAAAALLVAGGLGGYLVGASGFGFGPDSDDRMAELAIAAHQTFAADKNRPVEVDGSDPAYLTGWLSKRTGLKLVAPDLSVNGFQLLGGRLVPAEGSTAALMLYADAQGNRISVYVTTGGSELSKGTYTLAGGGPEAVYWQEKGYGCAVVGTLPPAELRLVAKDAYKQLLAGAGLSQS
ncbi:anti-sigma factor [Aminobacter sp. P9b]|uniref:Anti-sigma factor RsiW n=1 Tax=Aminobacter niigataensis TaxID=83265 RepID=A0ABR6L0B7_9HYPH|nr:MULTISPECIES: anti-sigma factor [Aminobacter]AWC24776.1 putative anti-sigmaE protein [Aminobacter sp. MSH1]MBB4650185.1 anti-sigma factor RsiW [Aminobacter niigataensis]